ncbi:transposase family protein [Streptomyces acidicola]|uniref:transposase family protein n=1 Tax=Streptomyces acidicola TaxID=2596892 RepID=UPI001D13426D|nr:transposase family protein [Streptomyces acidicola]
MPTVLAQLGRTAAPVPLADAVALSGFLDLVPDPRGIRGRRYRLSALVAAAAASVLAGARSLTAITEWIGDVPAWACRVLGFPADPLSGTVPVPHPHTLRPLLVQLDGDALDRAIGAFLTARATSAGRPTLPCIKTWRPPAASPERWRPWLLSSVSPWAGFSWMVRTRSGWQASRARWLTVRCAGSAWGLWSGGSSSAAGPWGCSWSRARLRTWARWHGLWTHDGMA